MLRYKNRSLLTKEEKHLLERAKRATQGAKVPALNRIYLLELDEGQSVEKAVAAYSQDPDVEYAEPDYILSINITPDDPLYPLQWSLDNTGQMYPASGDYNDPPGTPDSDIDAPEAWDTATGSADVIVAVIDTGVDYTHRDLDDNMWVNEAELNGTPDIDDDGNGYIDDIHGYDFCTYGGETRDPDPIDDYGHGTHVSGTIAAEGNNSLDITGVCWNTRIMAVKFIGVSGYGYTSDAVASFYYAVENGADVTSNSWGGGPYSQSLEDAINYAYSQGVVTVTSAGNNGSATPYYPACYEHAIAVIATNSNDQKPGFSNYGDWCDVSAPGVDILSLRASGTSMGSVYDEYTTVASGTSMACPHVSGLAALVISMDPTLSSDGVRQIIRDSADDLGDPGFDIYYGYGRINAYQVVNGRIYFNRNWYTAPYQALITVTDTDLNIDPAINDTVTIEVYSTTETDPEFIVLTETGPNSNIFEGYVLLESSQPGETFPNDGILKVQHGDILTARYEAVFPPGIIRVTTAHIDLEPPIIIGLIQSEPEFTIEGAVYTTITWQTDEVSTSTVYYGETSLDSSVTSEEYVTEHVVILSGLAINTTYVFAIESVDRAGNVTYDDNGGMNHQFTMLPPIIEVTLHSNIVRSPDPYVPPRGIVLETEEGTLPFTVHEALTISNIAAQGSADLLFEIETSQDWLSVVPVTGQIPAEASMDIDVIVDPRQLETGTYTGEIIIYNNSIVNSPVTIPVTLTAIPAPVVHYRRYRIIDDWSGRSFHVNGDGRLNPGERIELQIEARNVGSLLAQDVTANIYLIETDPYITIMDDTH